MVHLVHFACEQIRQVLYSPNLIHLKMGMQWRWFFTTHREGVNIFGHCMDLPWFERDSQNTSVSHGFCLPSSSLFLSVFRGPLQGAVSEPLTVPLNHPQASIPYFHFSWCYSSTERERQAHRGRLVGTQQASTGGSTYLIQLVG